MEEPIESEDAVIASHRPLFAMGEARQSPVLSDTGDCFASPEGDGSQRRAPALSVIIVTHESAADIGACLKSVILEAVTIPHEIIVVDAGSTDETKTTVHQNCATARYFQLRNTGFAAAANLGAAQARGNVLLFLNPDATLMSGALSKLEERFKEQEWVGVVGGYLMTTPDTPEKWQAMPFPSLINVLLSHIGKPKGLASIFPYSLQPTPYTPVSWVSGGALAVRKDDFVNIGGFNEKYFLYFEDVDLCRRMRDVGFGILLDPQMRVLHQGGKSTNQEKRIGAYDRSQSTYFRLQRPLLEYLSLLLLRFVFRYWLGLLAGISLVVIAVIGGAVNRWLELLILGMAFAIVGLTYRLPRFGMGILFGSIMLGQTVRLGAGGFMGTVTDAVLPLVVVGLVYAVIAQKKLRDLVGWAVSGWWILAAFLPGLILAWQRLPQADFLVTISYFLRLLGMLCLLPLVRTLNIRFSFIKKLVIVVGMLLAFIGFLQLIVLPTLPPANQTIFTQIFLALSGGGWDPHQFRLFSTWLDPNFLGMYFVITLGLIIGDFGNFFTTTDPGSEQGCSDPGSASRSGPLSYLLTSLVVFIALTLTRSRASFLALGVMLVAYFIFTKTKRVFVPIITVLGLVLLMFPALSSRIFVAPLADPTVQLRMQSWQQAIDHFEKFPWFGMGYNAYGVEQMAAGNVSNQNIHSLAGADNFTLLVLSTVGLWGVVILLFGVSRFMATMLHYARSNQPEALSIILVLFALFVHAQFIQSFTYIHLFLPVVLLVGTCLTFRESPLKETP